MGRGPRENLVEGWECLWPEVGLHRCVYFSKLSNCTVNMNAFCSSKFYLERKKKHVSQYRTLVNDLHAENI